MKEIIFMLGGCRSGKSRYALERAEQMSEKNKIFIAACIPHGKEMEQRIERHKRERALDRKTLEVPLLLPEPFLKTVVRRG